MQPDAPCALIIRDDNGREVMMSSQLPLRRRDKNFYTWTGARPAVNVHGRVMRPPFFYHRADAFQSIHLASFDAVQGILPSADLHPIRWFDGRALVGIGVFRYARLVRGRRGNDQAARPLR